ncbi:peptidase, M1 family [Formosa agariphila KMM 3901]|uniref:Peptidase, M1 family n=1 Tax=Formosa agariphila (strain DSM 15362 / KCTC 12365 / LMG 23005 / KMM 3901 / M-2Alg 35-1) TaxID=1347342 RepID=T2KRX8_FORAG|nr:M1 family metallopeptidase [Formosa agariphila]CDF81271.1 peptidase, M1 family [Formosa agariphila KMM 3901]
MKHIFKALLLLLLVFTSCKSSDAVLSSNSKSNTDPTYWQQHVDYTMTIDMDVETYQYKGVQKLVYTNNSPDVLTSVYYHLFLNAFQPGSEMDARLQSIEDPDGRMMENGKSRISTLKPNETGYIKINSLKQNGNPITYQTEGTILEVKLKNPIQPGEKVTFDMDYDAQIPLQIRRSGRNSKEGVALSMTQWYPKLAEYDFEGWHADPYIGREFHGVWGDFDVTINIDKNYTIGGTGYLQNPNEIGHGYETGSVKTPEGDKLSWHFIAPNVHDFTWAADPEYIHDTMQVPEGPLLHFFYKNNPEIKENWKNLQPKTVELMEFFSKEIGKYPYKQYSVIQGGDGGMEYAMCTLITGERKFGSLVGVTAHELAHTWFQFLLASNESKHEWMDEGFTSYISDQAMNVIMKENKENPSEGAYRGYYYLVNSGKEQPQSTHSDRYDCNMAYSIAAYNKGEVFLAQLGYVIGQDNLEKTLKKYFTDFSFKHPRPIDVIRSAEKVSGLELDWYLTDWTQTTNTIDYGIASVDESGSTTNVTLQRIGLMPMPLDIEVTYANGTKEQFYIPLTMMRGEKPATTTRTQVKDWAWAYPTYTFTINKSKSDIKNITIDPKELMADIDKSNNVYSK